MTIYSSHKAGHRVLIYRGDTMIAYLDQEGVTQQRNRIGVFTRSSDWTGRYEFHMNGEQHIVRSIGEGLILASRLEEINAA